MYVQVLAQITAHMCLCVYSGCILFWRANLLHFLYYHADNALQKKCIACKFVLFYPLHNSFLVSKYYIGVLGQSEVCPELCSFLEQGW